MDRAGWQLLAEERIRAAGVLLANGEWSSAYYLAGYAVEFGLKSCILARVAATGIIFFEKKFSERCFSHKVEELVDLAGLEKARIAETVANAAFGQNWLVVQAWNEISRYQQWAQPKAQELYDAITNNPNGVMTWIRGHW